MTGRGSREFWGGRLWTECVRGPKSSQELPGTSRVVRPGHRDEVRAWRDRRHGLEQPWPSEQLDQGHLFSSATLSASGEETKESCSTRDPSQHGAGVGWRGCKREERVGGAQWDKPHSLPTLPLCLLLSESQQEPWLVRVDVLWGGGLCQRDSQISSLSV